MYTLTLSSDERRALDFIGYRYNHGEKFSDLLITECEWDGEWDAPTDIEFRIPEYIAWQIQEIFKESSYECMSTSFIKTIQNFLDKIV